jgi:hypothetical protein
MVRLRGAILSIDSTLTFRYFSRNKKQNYVGLVNAKFWDTLNKKLETMKFRTTRFPAYDNCEYCPVFILMIKWKNHERKILRAWIDPKDSLLNVLIWLNNSYQHIKSTEVDSSFKFEMKYPIILQVKVKFPPPLPKQKKKRNSRLIFAAIVSPRKFHFFVG